MHFPAEIAIRVLDAVMSGHCLFFNLSGTKVAVEREIMLDGTMVSAAFDNSMDMGIVGTTAGTLWYINWSDSSSIRLVSGHRSKVTAGSLQLSSKKLVEVIRKPEAAAF